jgi:hypothetical protein
MTEDMVMASACLPFAFQAVEIDGEACWDGGYMGKPALFPSLMILNHATLSKFHTLISIGPGRHEAIELF